ncbi:hypothetical protein FRC07_006949 [Ceratobasidium sp. 392]|nr:hypothetical protein FRC07_006949 [Ceratobasidium sp. 392]
MTARKARIREHVPAAEQSSQNHGRGPLRSWEMTPDQHVAMGPMEYHVSRDLLFINPWPQDCNTVLEDAKDYTTKITGIDSGDVFTWRFMETVYSKMPANQGEVLAKIEAVVQQELAVSVADKPEIKMYLDKDNFLYPTFSRPEEHKFCVHLIGTVILTLLFECGKLLGYVFMEEVNWPDDARKCADWHSKTRDQMARGRGVSPGLIAYAATQIHWALLKLQKGGKLAFSEGQFREVWDRYFYALMKLKHLGELCMDLLDLVRNYYVQRWLGEVRGDEEDEDLHPAW